jgi:DNA-binding NarL/FixJ family response regulator
MPVMNGLEAAEKIALAKLPVRVLLFSTHDSSYFMTEARKLGVHGYVCKSSGEQCLIDAMKTVLSGAHYFAPTGPPPAAAASSRPATSG